MKRKLFFILSLIIISFGYFNLKCIPNAAKMPYFYGLVFDTAITNRKIGYNTYILNEYGNFVDFDKIYNGRQASGYGHVGLANVNYGDPPEFDKTKLNHTVLVKYTINNQAYNDTLDIYTKLEYDNYRQQDTYFLNDLLINGVSIYTPENIKYKTLIYYRKIPNFGNVYSIEEAAIRNKTKFQ